jgi:EAL domain-containing protein (putative c-di-GMP-specific phosphodiesterase class I)
LQRKTVFSIAQLVRNLRIKVIVEGVETLAQAQILRSMGLAVHQGYLHARPMRAEELQENYAHIGADMQKRAPLTPAEKFYFEQKISAE